MGGVVEGLNCCNGDCQLDCDEQLMKWKTVFKFSL